MGMVDLASCRLNEFVVVDPDGFRLGFVVKEADA
jgi:hypothetical protein